MGQINRQEEKVRLQERYKGRSDEELAKIAADPATLTAVAGEVLNEELMSRGLPALSTFAERRRAQELEQKALTPVQIRRYRDLPEANIAKSVLESAGIESFLVDENLVRLDWFYSNLIGGIKLLVHQRDVEAANSVLDEATPERFNVAGVGEYLQPHCPKCQSMDISLDGLDKRWTYGAMGLINLPIPVTHQGWKCHSCGHEWKEENDLNSAATDSRSENSE